MHFKEKKKFFALTNNLISFICFKDNALGTGNKTAPYISSIKIIPQNTSPHANSSNQKISVTRKNSTDTSNQKGQYSLVRQFSDNNSNNKNSNKDNQTQMNMV